MIVVLATASHADGGVNRATLYQSRDDRYFLSHAEYVCHNLIIPERSGMSIGKRNKLGLFGGFLFSSPTLCGGGFSHLATLFWRQKRHSALTPGFTAFSAHTGHNLGEQCPGDRHFLVLPYGLKNYAAGVLNGIKAAIRLLGFTTCAVWHTLQACHGSDGASRGRLLTL